MSTPFPGMDPYLEHPSIWPGVHTRLMVALANQLGPKVRPRYVVSVEGRVFFEGPEEQRIPDVTVKRRDGPWGNQAVAEAPADEPLVVAVEGLEVTERFVNILDRYRDMRVVASVEVVSPSNKAAGPGREAYLQKQRETLSSERHLVEIDLLRRGAHVLGVPEGVVQGSGPYDYLVCLSRWPQPRKFELYFSRLRDRLPRVRIPLASPDPDVTLDLQRVLEQVYEEGDFMLQLRYEDRCVPALEPTDQDWANQRIATYKAAHADLFSPPPGPLPGSNP